MGALRYFIATIVGEILNTYITGFIIQFVPYLSQIPFIIWIMAGVWVTIVATLLERKGI